MTKRDQISLSSKAEGGLNLKPSPTSFCFVFECTCTEEVHLWTWFHSIWFLCLFGRWKCQIVKNLSVEHPLFQERGEILRGTENTQKIPSLANLWETPTPSHLKSISVFWKEAKGAIYEDISPWLLNIYSLQESVS